MTDLREPLAERTLPVAEEVVTVDKVVRETGTVRVRTLVEERHEVVRDTVRQGAVDVQRVPIGRFVTETPSVREEGDVLIVPVLEERAVVEKRLFLVEELRLTRTTRETPVEIPVTRRVERAVVEEDKSHNRNREELDV